MNKIPKNIFGLFFVFTLIILGSLMFSRQASAMTYYVDSSITDTHVGSSTPDFTTYNPTTFSTSTGSDSVYKTIADINAFSALAPGDSVLFRKGQTWREQLNVPSSGTDGNPITFGSYGSEGDPVISGADVVTGWVQSGVSTLTIQSSSMDTDIQSFQPNNNDGSNTYSLLVSSSGADISNNRTLLNFDFSALPDGSTINSATLSLFYFSHDFADPFGRTYWAYRLTQPAWTELGATWNKYDGTNAWTIAGGDYTSTDGVSTTVPHLVGSGVWMNWSVTNLAQYFQTNTSNIANFLIKDASETGDDIDANFVPKESTDSNKPKLAITYTATGGNAWKANNPRGNSTGITVIVDGIQYSPVSSMANLTTHTYFNDTSTDPDTIYIYSTDDPSGHTVQISNRDYGIYGLTKQYITIQNITTYGAGYAGVRFYGNQHAGYNLIDNVTSYYNRVMGIVVDGGQYHNTIQNSTAYGNGDGISANGDADYTTIKGNTTYGNITYSVSTQPSVDGDGIGVFSSSNTIIENNKSYDNIGNGISVDLNGTDSGVDIRYNKTYHNGSTLEGYGVNLGGGIGSVDDNRIYGNIAYKNDENSANDTCLNYTLYGPVTAHNNVSYCDGTTGSNVGFSAVSGDVVLKNNIAYTSGGATSQIAVDRSSAANLTSDNNLWFNASGGNIAKDNTTAKTFLQWQGLGYDGASVNSDPLFTNASGSDFTITSISPAIDQGVSLGDTYKLGLNPNSVWPNAVNTLDQTLNGLWDIGAYVYTQSSAPTVSISTPSAGVISASVSVTATAGATSPATVSSVQFYLDGIALQSPVTISPYTITWDTTASTNASHTLTAVATDNYSNTTTSTGVVVTVDNLGPTGTISNGNGSPTNSVTPTLNLTIADAGVGVTGAQMQFSCDDTNWSAWESYATPKTNFNVRTDEGCTDVDGSKTVYVEYKDSLGNVGSSYNTGAFTLNTSTSFATLSGTPTSITNSTSASITIAGTDITAYEYKLDSGSYGTETLIATPISLSSLADGSHTLSVIGKNSVGTWQDQGAATTYTWTVDTTAPVVTFSIPATSNSLTVTFTSFSATDANTITGYLVNETATTPAIDDTGWAGTTQAQYVFTTEGAKTLYAWVKDSVGNISTSANASVNIDTDAPATPIATPSSGTYTSTQTITLSAEGSDTIRYSTTGIPATCSSDTLYTTPITVSSSQTIYVRACDTLNNSSTVSFAYVINIHTSSGSSSGGSYVVTPPPIKELSDLEKTLAMIEKYKAQQNNSPVTLLPIIRILKLTTPRMWGDDILALQTYLNTKGYSTGTPDGNFGPKTQTGVISFQKANGLIPDGVVGPNTLKYLNGDQTTTTTSPIIQSTITRILKLLVPRMIGDDVKSLQTYLSTNGYDVGTPDGIFGSKTYSAVIAFQTANNLNPDGLVGAKTLEIMK